HEWLYFQFSNNRAIRRGDDKLVSVKGRPWELYDLAEDRSELTDLSKRQPTRAKELKELWFDVAEKVEQAPKNLRKSIKLKSKNKK
ncbi:MAG: arylsulfatase, partial [Planctomycetota bacterium]